MKAEVIQKFSFQNPKFEIICIIFKMSGAFFGLAAILNFSAILNFKERLKEEKNLEFQTIFKIIK
jgi:hypothetical protein